MEFKMHPREVQWWFWPATLVFIVLALAGSPWAHLVVIAISAIQIVFFWVQDGSLVSFATQVRIVYFLFTLVGLWPVARLPAYALLLVGTIMVTFFDRCAIALVLKRMPWNRPHELKPS